MFNLHKKTLMSAILITLLLLAGNSFGEEFKLGGNSLFENELIDTLWIQDWESGWGDWYADNGVWEIGVPTIGPDSAHSGTNCAGTILDGNYPNYTNTRLISPPFTVPNSNQNPQLRFWHWFIIYGGDYGVVEIKVDHPDSNWVEVSNHFSEANPVWNPFIISLSAYSGESIRIAFHFITDSHGENPGWYIDDVSLTTGSYIFNNPEDWESGWGDWYADNGVWEIGVPTIGPDSAHSGTNCAGTILDGNYPNYTNTRLISPPFTVPNSNQNPQLRFWHWFIIYGGDYGVVEIKVDHPDSNWVEVSNHFSEANPVWNPFVVPLSAYSEESIRIAFHFITDSHGENAGWYIDDISIEPIEGYFEIVFDSSDFIFAVPGDTIVSRTFLLISHNATGYVNSNYSANWVYIRPDSVNLEPDDTTTVTVYFNSAGLNYRTYYTNIQFESNVAGLENAVIPVEMTVYAPLDVTVEVAEENLYPGDTLSANIMVENPTNKTVSGRFATGLLLPNGNQYGPIFGPINISMLPYGTLSGRIEHVVPGNAPVGDYRYLVGISAGDIIIGYGFDNFSILSGGSLDRKNIVVDGFHPVEWEVIYSDFEEMQPYSSKHADGIIPAEVTCNNYPNPFNAATRIEYTVPNASDVSMEIYNILGQKVETLAEGFEEPGYKSCIWDASRYSSGIYFYKLTAGNKVITKRMTVLK